MLDSISIFIFGALTLGIPIAMWYIINMLKKSKVSIEIFREELQKSLIELNRLHNSAAERYKSFETRLTKIETENAAKNFGGKR